MVAGVAVVFAKEPVTAPNRDKVVMLTFPAPPVAKPQPPKPKPPKPKPTPPKPVHHVVHRPPPKPVQQPKLVQAPPTSQPPSRGMPA